MQPDPTNLIEKIGLKTPLIGFYDAPDTGPFEPLVKPKTGVWACTFAFYKQWLCGLGKESFLYKPFWKDLMKARGVADLQELLEGVSETNLHSEFDTGAPTGKEIW